MTTDATRLAVCALAYAVTAVIPAPAQQLVPFARHGLPPGLDTTWAVRLGDVDGDGDLDLVCGNAGSATQQSRTTGRQNRLYLNDGHGHFRDATARLPRDADSTWASPLADVDGDGDLDLILGNSPVNGGSSGRNKLYLNDGRGWFTDVTAAAMPALTESTWALYLRDFDGDGDPDIVTGNYGPDLAGEQTGLYFNDGKGRFTDVTAGRMPVDDDRTWALCAGDVDGDGDFDVVTGNLPIFEPGGQNKLYVNDGKGFFRDVTAAQFPRDTDLTYSMIMGDVDGDGDIDMVIGNLGQNRLYRNDGRGRFTDDTRRSLPADDSYVYTYALKLADLDGDGDPDLIAGNGLPGEVSLGLPNRYYENDGKGRFRDVTDWRLAADLDRTVALDVGDVDGDGDVDVVAGNGNDFAPSGPSGTNRIYVNLTRCLHPAGPARIGERYRVDVYARGGRPLRAQTVRCFAGLALLRPGVELPPFGTVHVDPARAIALPPVKLLPPDPAAVVELAIPRVAALVGQRLYTQALFQHGPRPSSWRLSNVAVDRIAR